MYSRYHQNSTLHDKQQIKILQRSQMCVLKTIWYTIVWNHAKENKCIIKDMIRRKIP